MVPLNQRFSVLLFAMIAVLFVSVPASAVPVYQEADTCPFAEHDIHCGVVKVRENRLTGRGALIDINIYIIESHSAVPASDSIVFLTGGPGIPSKDDVYTFYEFDSIRERRDIILIDQRGTDVRTGLCPELASFDLALTYLDLTVKEREARYVRGLKRCFQKLWSGGRDINAINNGASALDIRDVRIALGIDRWNIWGVSYGTALGLEVMAADADGVRAVILDSVSPLDIPWDQDATANYYDSLAKIANLCLSIASCKRSFGDLVVLRKKALQSLAEDPLRFQYYADLSAWASGESSVGVLNDHDLSYLVSGLSYFRTDINLVPLFLKAVLERDSEVVSAIVTHQIEILDSYKMDDGTFYAIACGLNDVSKKKESSRQMDQSQIDIPPYDDLRIEPYCDQLGLKPLPDRTNSLTLVTAPALLMSGEYDPVTPPKWGAHVEKLLPNASHLLFPNGFHAVSQTECGLALVSNFLENPHHDYDASCVQKRESAVFASGLVKSQISERMFGRDASPVSFLIYALPAGIILAWLYVRLAAVARLRSTDERPSRFVDMSVGLMLMFVAWLVASIVHTHVNHTNIAWMGIGFVPLYSTAFIWIMPIALVAGSALLVETVLDMRKGAIASSISVKRIALGLAILWLSLLFASENLMPKQISSFWSALI